MMKYISMVLAIKDNMYSVQSQKKYSSKRSLKYPWLSIQICDTMMERRNGIFRALESIRNSMSPRAKEKH
jgi:hypothetical protein